MFSHIEQQKSVYYTNNLQILRPHTLVYKEKATPIGFLCSSLFKPILNPFVTNNFLLFRDCFNVLILLLKKGIVNPNYF
ncbi:hypothetical protein GGTG_02117 [Gaeumannomyces tritici R3-111a-1]|uniref:Uncharacterized protein n=1 Tax=Gaeumannomyces tritici (strain R3-111a-1) TaxID=644352 RepID=J3NLG8_GAET3|nr:hypothetical protein GGTG_02117 [Gaeumannomyces tritici R3-111a-1]EJT82143.1 hypothetical protein GGTG_02117 [Gaeumannomyces tritici R3-111a-1]